ncbi:MAG TPA: lysine--tRNA ligase [Acidimicrobiales bacterium]|nr:lysine--tRNA ligase [Acidimicrobiales bacterium]
MSELPYAFAHDAFARDVAERFGALVPGEESGTTVAVAGRVMLVRPQGKLAFATLRDSTGEVQLFALAAVTASFERFGELHLGDWVGAVGEVVRTKRGELSVKVATFVVLAATELGFGDKWHGITDPDLRYRHREADLWANPESRSVLDRRHALLRSVREQLWRRGFVEVETPILNAIPSGGTAARFSTHYNSLDTDMFLRIAPELWLKRLVVGGYERVFEVGKLFRNEGISPWHAPEFTTVELYAAYWDFEDMMALTEELIADCVTDVLGTTSLTYQGRPLELAAPWRRASMAELVSDALGEEVSVRTPVDVLRTHLSDRGEPVPPPSWGPGKLLEELFGAVVERSMWSPTFVTDYPVEVSPLARRHRLDHELTERFEVFCVGHEFANGFSELTDPADQRERFEAQAKARAEGDDEAMAMDEDYLVALQYGLPPTAGLGIGIDRVAMVLGDVANIREVIAFPTLKPRGDAGSGG